MPPLTVAGVVTPAALLALLFTVHSPVLGAAEPGVEVYQRTTSKPVAEALEDAAFAVTDRNFRIVNTLHIGSAIRDREQNVFPDYEVILFCNLDYARQMLELEPAFIVLCPGRVTVRQEAAGSTIAAPLLPVGSNNAPLDALMERINGQIRQIVDHAAEEWNRKLP